LLDPFELGVASSSSHLSSNRELSPRIEATMPHIVSVATAVPKHSLKQCEICELARHHFQGSLPNVESYLSIFQNAAVNQRYFCVPPDWFLSTASLGQTNRAYLRNAQELGTRVAADCLAQAAIAVDKIDGLIFVSSSGIATPSLDTTIANTLKFRRDICRVPIFGLGCAGGAAALSLAGDLTRARPRSRFLVVALELNSLTFQRTDFSLQNLVATALFSDGAAAVLVSGDEAGLEGPLKIVRSVTIRSADTEGLMGWDFGNQGFRVVVSKNIPKAVESLMLEVLNHFSDIVRLEELNSFVLHPGGAKILRAFETILKKTSNDFSDSHETLARFGNMSSPTVLFVLDSKLKNRRMDEQGHCLLGAFGPGFTAEASLLRWTD
jgi:alkylresorcinol/alkylpyrone synthase